jgi:TolB-like protein/Tfp pilus assembly protein PilF/class 3 adenylate cyclase
MSADSKSEVHLEIAHVLTMDVVEYSTLLITEQTRVLAELTRVVKETTRFRRGEAEGKLVRIPTGDGMLLVFFDDPQAPIECAMEIAAAMKSHPDIRLRMGIHSGPVNEVVDVNNRTNVAGAGVDMAQRVMDCGDAGHILLSKRVAEDLAPFPRWNPHLHDLGECEVKHGRKVSLVNFYTDEIGNPEAPRKCAAAQEKRNERSTSTSATRPARVRVRVAAATLLILGAVLVFFFLRRQSPPNVSVGPSLSPKSIAVLPFENLSHDPDNAYFADGIQEEILTRLSKIADLKVISRTSTQRYKSAPANLSEIAKQLGVAHVLEGTVQKAADQVRVNVQLIKAENDSHVWADKFDRKLTDIFSVESEIATKIADTLQAKLTGAEEKAIASRPTESSDAYQLYLKGRYFLSKRTKQTLKKAIEYFNEAVSKDPNYALAYAGMAEAYALLPEWSDEPAANYFPRAGAAATKALAIDDSLAEAHTSLALVLLNDFDFKGSKKEFERAIELNPNYADAHYFLGIAILPLRGVFDQAIAEVKRAVELDPLSAIINANLGYCYFLARRYDDAIFEARKTIELDPNFVYGHVVLAHALELKGDLGQAIAIYQTLHQKNKGYRSLVFLAHLHGLKGEREKALERLGQAKDLEEKAGIVWAYGYALAYLGLGDKSKAIDWLEQSYRAKETGNIVYIKVEPLFDSLRGDPRFEKLANQIVPKDSDK